jgi:hypothetical protein
MPLLTKLFAGFLVAVTSAALLIIMLYPSERTTTIVAITALLITTGKTGYDIYDKERERRRKSEESRERITATAKYGTWDSTGNELGVVIYNQGSAPVNIASVECGYTMSGESKTFEFTNMAFKRTEVVQPKHTVRFRCGGFHDDVLAALARLPEKYVWITVKTQEGETVRIEGNEIIRALTSPPTSQLR